ncbi:hypothetical protein AOLI_G00014680 [Acnodon oligacanthus]
MSGDPYMDRDTDPGTDRDTDTDPGTDQDTDTDQRPTGELMALITGFTGTTTTTIGRLGSGPPLPTSGLSYQLSPGCLHIPEYQWCHQS